MELVHVTILKALYTPPGRRCRQGDTMHHGPIGVAVIGAGMAGRAHCAGYRSAPTLFDPPLPPIHCAAVIDANAATAADAAERYGYERHGTDWRDLLEA